jgi:hypothetical protein
MLIIHVYKGLKLLPLVPVEFLLEVGIQGEVVLAHVLEQVIGAEDLSHFN